MTSRHLEEKEEGQAVPGPEDREEGLSCSEDLSPYQEDEEELPCSQPQTCGVIRMLTVSPTPEEKVLNLMDPEDLAELQSLVAGIVPPAPEAPAGDYARVEVIHTTRIKIGGLISVVLDFMFRKHRIDIDDRDLNELINVSTEVGKLEEALPIIFATIQAVAHTPNLAKFLEWWRQGLEGLQFASAPGPSDRAKVQKPWEGYRFWTFETWSLADAVTARFMLHQETPSEDDFLASLTELRKTAGLQGWKVGIIVATLFGIRRAPWFWDLMVY